MTIVRINRWKPGDSFSPLTELASTTYPGQEMSSEAYLDWQYVLNPHGPVLLHTGQSDDRTIAQYLVIPRNYRCGATSLKGSLSVNTLTHPEFRGAGWFVRLAEATYDSCTSEDIAFTLGFPNKESRPGFTGPLHFKSLGDLSFLALPLRWTGILNRFLGKDRTRKGAELYLNIPEPCLYRSKDYCIEDWEPGPLSVDFFHAFHATGKFTTERSDDYMMWRYLKCPTRRYRFLRITDPDRRRMLGFVVLRAIKLSGLRCGVLVDFGYLSDEPLALSELFRFSVDRFKDSGMDAVIAAAVPRCSSEQLLRSEGFLRVPSRLLPQHLTVIQRLHDPKQAARVPTDLESWFLTFGDYDVL